MVFLIFCHHSRTNNDTEWIQFKTRKILAREFYDHKHDPYEYKDVIEDDVYAKNYTEVGSATCNKKIGNKS